MIFDWLFKNKKKPEACYWIGYVKYNYLQTVDCHGNEVKEPFSVPTERQYSVYAVDQESAMDQLYDMFARSCMVWSENPLDVEIEPEYAVRKATKEEVDRMVVT